MGRKGNKAKAKSASAREAQNRRAETSANAPQNVRRPNEHGGSSTEQSAAADANERAGVVAELVMLHLVPAVLAVAVRDSGTSDGPVRLVPAGACCLSAACLLAAPPGLLEFLCRVPWDSLTGVGAESRDMEGILKAAAKGSPETAPRRKALVNTPLEDAMLQVLLQFLAMPQVEPFLPPVLAALPTAQARRNAALSDGAGRLTLGGAAALLDMATPLHCAAIRGSPAALDQLLMSGADVTLTTAAGMLPLELLPGCKWEGGSLLCVCKAPGEASGEEGCAVDISRQLLLVQGLLWFRTGLLMWAVMFVLSALAGLGFIFRDPPLQSHKLSKHLQRRVTQSQAAAHHSAERLIRSIREEAGEGKRCLGLLDDPDPAATDKVIDVERAYQCFVRCVHTLQRIADPPPPGLGMTLTERAELYRLWSESMLLQFRACACPTCAETLSQVANMAHLQVSRLCAEAEVLIESSLDLAARPAVEVMMGSAGQAPGTVEGPNGARGALRYVSTSGVELGDVGELLRPPRVPAGLEAGGRESATATAEWCGVGVNLARIVGAHVAVLLGVDCARSPTPASLACAQQCLTQWRKLSSQGLTRIAGLPSATATEVQSLEKWARRAHATIRIAEAAAGGMRPADSVEAALSSALEVTPDGGGGEGGARVVRVVQAPSRTWVEAVERALDYHGRHADAEVVDVVGEGVKSARRELEIQEELLQLTGTDAGFGDFGTEQLEDLVEAAGAFPRLESLRTMARMQLDQCKESEEALRNLRGAMAAAIEQQERMSAGLEPKGPGSDTERSDNMSETCGSAPSSLPLSGPGTPGKEPTVLEMADSAGPDKLLALKDAAATLQSAMASVQRSAMGAALGDARRLLRTLQAKVQAVEAFASLREAMREVEEASSAREKEAAANGTPSASAPLVTPRLARQRLRSAIPAGEAAVQALRGVVGSAELSALQDRLTEARRRHVGERAVESLEKLVSGASSVSELGRLEQAIREAEQFSKGATHESALRRAKDLRQHMDGAIKVQQALYKGLLQLKHADESGRADAEKAVASAVARGEAFLQEDEPRPEFVEAFVKEELGKAKGQLEAWRAAAEAQSQLTNAMRSAQSAADVEAAIQQASAVGIRVSKAKKLLRALQVLEGTLAQGSTHHGSLASLEEAIKVAAMAGVNQTVIRRACGELADRQLKASEKALEEVAASWGGMSASQRRSAARGALDRAKERLLAVSDSLSCKSTAGKGPAAEGSGDKGGDPDGIAARVAALIERVEGLVAADEAEAKARETKRKAEEVESRAEEKKAQEGKEKGKIAEGKKGSLKKQDAKETRKRVVEAIQTEAKARGPKESAEETAERGADAAAAGKDTGDEAAAGETCAWAAVTSPPHTGADSAAISRETSKSSQDSSAASVVAAKWDSPTWAGIEDGARVRGGHQRSSTWAQLEAELLSQTLGEGAAMSPLGPGSRAMSGLGWNEGAGAQAQRGALRPPISPLGASAGAVSDLHTELMQLLMPDGHGAGWDLPADSRPLSPSEGDASPGVPLPVQDTPLRTGPFPRNSDVGETWAPPQQQRTSNSGSASRQSLSLHRRAPSKGFVAEVGGSPLFSSSLFASVFNLSAPLTPTANNASSAGRASPGDLDLAAIGALMGDDGFHAGTPPADGAGLTGPSPGGGRNFSPGQRGPGELSAEAVPFQATRPRVSPPRWEYAEYGYGVGHGGGGGGEHQQWPMPPRIPAEKPQPPPRPAVVPPLDFSGLSKGGGAEGAVGWVEGGGMVGHGQWGTYVVPPYVPAPPARPKGKGKGKKESGEAEGKRKEEGEKDGGGKEESEGAGRRGEGEDGVAGERGGDCSTGEKDQSD